MAFIVEDGTGLTDSNSYVSVQEYRDYFADRNIDVLSETNATIEGYLVQATDFLDIQYEYKGEQLLDTQALQFPRNISDTEGVIHNVGVPKAVKISAIQSVVALKGGVDMFNDTSTNISSERSKVGPIETSKTYTETVRSSVERFKQINLLLKPFLSKSVGFQSQIPVITG